MIPAEVLAQRLAFMTHIDILVARDIVRAWQTLSPDTRLSTALIPDLMNVITEIATAYGEVTGVAAADFYDYMSDLAGMNLPAAVPANPVPPEAQVEGIARWATGPLRFEVPLAVLALQRLVDATQRLAHWPGRLTVFEMAKRDRIRFARVPQGKTCGFCLMLASRGAVYWSRESAGEFDKYHDGCDCAVISVPRDDDLPGINREMHDAWQEVTHGQRDQVAAWNRYVTENYGATMVDPHKLEWTAKRRKRYRY